MDDISLTSQAIVELMREMQGQESASAIPTLHGLGPQERKKNPLGKTNKRFLGRTINTALRHNKREIERTQAGCLQKLQQLDERKEKRKANSYFNGEGASPGQRSRSRAKKKAKRRSRSSSRSSSCSRSHKKKRKKKHQKSEQRHRSVSRPIEDASVDNEQTASTAVHDYYAQHSKNMALAVAMAYSQALYAQTASVNDAATNNKPNGKAPASPMSDIIKELMSDEEEGKMKAATLLSSSEDEQELLTIDVSSTCGTEDSDDDSNSNGTGCSAGSCIELGDSDSDMDQQKVASSDLKINSCEQAEQQQPNQHPATTIDLTDD